MKVSIIMLTYNHEKFIAAAIEGVLVQQANFSFELIVANDHSTDYTEAIVETYRGKSPAIIKGFCNKKNLGPRFNFIKAYSRAAGEYIALCEGDDYWRDPGKLQQQVDFLEYNKDFILSFHDIEMIDEEGKPMDDQRQPPESKRDFDRNGLLGSYIPTPTIVFRNILKTLPAAFEKTDNGDALLQALLTRRGKAKYFAGIQPAVVRVHGGGIWSSRHYLAKWSSTLKTHYLIFKSLDAGLRKNVAAQYIDMYEMASWDANHYASKQYWYRYNSRYLQFCIIAGFYGKAFLISRRMFHKMFNR